MKITKKSMLSKKVTTLDLPVTQEQLDKWKGGELIQKAMPHLTPDQREFLMTGMTSEEWDEMFPKERE